LTFACHVMSGQDLTLGLCDNVVVIISTTL